MLVQSEALFQWLVATIGAIISFLVSMAIHNNRMKYRDLDTRLTKVEDRMNTAIPESIQSLRTQIALVEGSIREMNTKVELISDTFNHRVDKLEQDMPNIVEAALYRAITSGKFNIALNDTASSH